MSELASSVVSPPAAHAESPRSIAAAAAMIAVDLVNRMEPPCSQRTSRGRRWVGFVYDAPGAVTHDKTLRVSELNKLSIRNE